MRPPLMWVLLCLASAPTLVPAAAGDGSAQAREESYTHTVRVSSPLEEEELWQRGVELIVQTADGGEVLNRMSVTGEGSYVFDLPTGRDWVITCKSIHFWCPNVVKRTSAPELSSNLTLFRASDVSGKVLVEKAHSLPERLAVHGWLNVEGDKDPVARFAEEIALDETGKFEFRGPQGKLDLKISSKGWAPVYLWGVEASSSTTLKPLSLKTGSSISGFVWDGVEELPLARAEVAAFPAGVDPGYSGNRKLELLGSATNTNDRGFFQLQGLVPGMFRLEITAADRSPRIIERVEVQEDSETLLDGKIVLSDSLSVDLYLDPRIPLPGERWTVRFGNTTRKVPETTRLEVQADSLGFARVEGLVPQSYLLEILDPWGSRIYLQEEYVGEDLVLEVELPVVGVEGAVTLNDEPLGAKIFLEAGFKDRSELTSDEETGHFAGIVRRPDWKILMVRIRGVEMDFDRSVVVKHPVVEDGVIHLDLDLIGIDVVGDVVDARGEPVVGATVWAHRGSRAVEAKTAADGAFILAALEEGSYDLHADHPQGESQIFPVELVEDFTPPSVRLVLQEKMTIQGLLVAPGNAPVRQAQISIYSAGPVPSVSSAESDIEGRFTFDVTPETSHVLLQVLAPSHVVWSGCVPVDTRSEEPAVTVTIPPAPGGQLEVKTLSDPESDEPPDVSSRLVLVSSDRGFLGFNEVYKWRLLTGEDSGGKFEPGNWKISGLATGRQYAVLKSSDPYWKIAASLCLGGLPSNLEWRYLPERGSARILVER